jgi:biofilm PGA synthesis N-glycosyltransferase PgaC
MPPSLSYAAVTPAWNEGANLRRLAECVAEQTLLPRRWVIVDDGSTDDTGVVARRIMRELDFATVVELPVTEPTTIRGGPIVAAFHAGLAALTPGADVVVKLDADVSFQADFFERLVRAFEQDSALGIASGTCYEQDSAGVWRPQYTARDHVRGATRAYRAACLESVLPLEERMGWDGIDELKAQVAGWRTASLRELPFHHHRPLGARERAWTKWVGQGDMAHYMGYRFGYLLARTGFRSLREPAAAGMLWGYVAAAARRHQRYADPEVLGHLRRQQSLRALPQRAREVLGRIRAGEDGQAAEPPQSPASSRPQL